MALLHDNGSTEQSASKWSSLTASHLCILDMTVVLREENERGFSADRQRLVTAYLSLDEALMLASHGQRLAGCPLMMMGVGKANLDQPSR